MGPREGPRVLESTMNRSSIPELLSDLDDIIERIRDAGLPVAALERARRSLPRVSVFEVNQVKRSEAQEAFGNARAMMRRLRGGT